MFKFRKKKNLNKVSKKIKFINLNSKSSLGSLIGIFFYIKQNNIKNIFCFHYLIASQLVILKFYLILNLTLLQEIIFHYQIQKNIIIKNFKKNLYLK